MRNEIQVNRPLPNDTDAALTSYMNTTPNLTINLFILRHDVNQGKGAAIHTGIAQATGDYLLEKDADQDDPGEYNTLMKSIVPGSADVVYGSRFNGGHPHRILFLWHRIGNQVLTFLSSMFRCRNAYNYG